MFSLIIMEPIPRADPYARGMVSGLTLSDTPDDVAMLYYATVQAIAYGTRHIIEAMNEKGYDIRKIHLSGGHLKNRVFIQEHADVTAVKSSSPKNRRRFSSVPPSWPLLRLGNIRASLRPWGPCPGRPGWSNPIQPPFPFMRRSTRCSKRCMTSAGHAPDDGSLLAGC